MQEAFPPGHYYSPVVDVNDRFAVSAVLRRLSGPPPAGIRIDDNEMSGMMERLARHHRLFDFPRTSAPGYRYYYDNDFFASHDGSVFFSMLLEFKPRRVVEVGCGFSSRLLLDTRDRFPELSTEVFLIDPKLSSLLSALNVSRDSRTNLIPQPVQEAPLSVFEQLGNDDILFLDCSHVCKTGSDVHYYLFEIFPRLRPGVLIHIHDILYPFEYPDTWVLRDRRSWNEAYVVRAFLEYNSRFEILYWNNYAFHRLQEQLRALMPICLENEGGSIWLKVK